MADKDLRVHLKADDDITPAAKKAKSSIDDIPDKKTVNVQATGLKELGEAADALPGPLGEAADVMGKLGGAGVAGGIGAVAAGMFLAADAAADMAIEAKTTADLTGSTVEEASKLQNLWARTGAGANDLNDVLLQMNGVLAQSPELAKQIGVNLNDGKNIQERFVELTDMLAAGQLTAVEASQLFGEEGVRQVGKLRTMYGGLSDDLEKMPAPVDDKDVAQAIEMQNAIAELKATLTATVGIVGKELVPVFGDLATVANEVAGVLPGGKDGGGADALKFIREWGTGIGLIAKGLDAVTGGDEITASFVESAGPVKSAAGQIADAYVDIIEKSAGQERAAKEVAGAYMEIVGAAMENVAAEDAVVDAYMDVVNAAIEMEQAIQNAADLRRGLADSEFAYRDAQRDFAQAIIDTTEAIGENGPATLEGAAALDEFAQNAGSAADAAVRLEGDQMSAAGATQSAADAQRTWNGSMITSARTTSGPMQQAIINYIATVNGIPPEKVSEILADPNYATIDAANAAIDKAAADETARITAEAATAQAERDLANAARDRTMTIHARMVAAGGGGAIGGAGPQVPRSVEPAVAGVTGYATPAVAATSTATGLPPIIVNVPAPPPTTVKFEVGVMGNRFDSQRAITKALRAHQRLNGVRP